MAANQVSGEISTVEANPIPTEPAKKPKRNARPYLPMATEALEKGLYTRKELVAAITNAFPELKKSAVETFATDLKNPRYCYYKPRLVVVASEEKLIFADCVQRQEEEAVPVEQEETAVENVASA